MFKPVQQNPSFPALELEIFEFWKSQEIFKKSLEQGKGKPQFTFYEGPPTANGKPGIHHVQARSYKDLFPRFRTMQGYYVPRKAGWDTHGLPVEVNVEKALKLESKRDVEAYGIAKFNEQCRESVFEFENLWRTFTERMGYWVDLDDAYMTLSKDYIESVWWSVGELNKKGLLYKGFRVAPYCPKDGTTLSNAEVSEGYKDIQDPSIYVIFPLLEPEKLDLPENSAFLVWTTTPWTIPYNVGVALHPDFTYSAVRDGERVLIVAKALVEKLFGEHAEVVKEFAASQLERVFYQAPYSEAYSLEGEGKTVWQAGLDSYVSDADGTGIVHTAPSFGEDDMRLARAYHWPVLVGVDAAGKHRFGPWTGVFFRDANKDIRADLKAKGVMWKDTNFLHSYPHCWRCGTPLMYYATESWFIRNTSQKDRLIELNQTIDWHPAHIKNGRYGAWLENLVDWNLSRNRFWGTPLPIWESEDGQRQHVITSYGELKDLALEPERIGETFDPHRPFIDDIQIKHPQTGETLTRVPYVMDVWYDSGAMPFAQHHYPFENKEIFEASHPADFIAEAIDQTRGWFNSLHQLGTMVFDKVAYKAVICHGHVLDEKGLKMSKTRGNIVDPWEMFNQYGADAVRWYMSVSAPPELSRRFGPNLLEQAFRQYFMTLWNTYSFFVMYANLDQPNLEAAPPVAQRPEVDRWLMAKLQAVIRTVTSALEGYDPTTAARALQEFVLEDVSNWYVRRNRRRFWKTDAPDLSAYATLHSVLVAITQLSAPITPFISEVLYQNLVVSVQPNAPQSVHLSSYPVVNPALEDAALVSEMEAVIKVVGLGRAIRGQQGLKTRQPLPKALLRARTAEQTASLGRFSEQIREELNVKEIELLEQFAELVEYTLKPNLPVVGKKVGKQVPQLKKALEQADASYVARMVREDRAFEVEADGFRFELQPNEVLVDAKSPEGYAALEDSGYLVAFDTTLTPALEREGLMRDLVRMVQDARKNAGLEVSDKIDLVLALEGVWLEAAQEWEAVITEEVQADTLVYAGTLEGSFGTDIEGGKLELRKATQ
jgi:isoleucyl-tRNA synthetase